MHFIWVPMYLAWKYKYWGHYSLCLQQETGPTFYLEQEQFGVSVLATL